MTQRMVVLVFILATAIILFRINAFKKQSIIDGLYIAGSIHAPHVILDAPDSVRHKAALASLVLQISAIEHFECGTVGFAGRRSTQPNFFSLLDSVASTKELAELSSHHNPYVRTCAFSGLAGRDTAFYVKKKIFDRHFNDREMVMNFCGCVIDGVPVNLRFYSFIASSLNKEDKKNIQKKLREMYKENLFFQWYIDDKPVR